MNTINTSIKADDIDWQKTEGLVPAVVQDESSLRVLMLGYMSKESFEQTIETGKVTFFSRSRQTLWQKGETSGNTLDVKKIQIDCDADTLLVFAKANGPTCHLLTESCFDTKKDPAEEQSSLNTTGSADFIMKLQHVIAARKKASADSSYTASLFESGTPKIAQKVGEEGVEVALAAVLAAAGRKSGTDQEQLETEFLGECADLVYHLLVALADQDLSMADVIKVLESRHSA